MKVSKEFKVGLLVVLGLLLLFIGVNFLKGGPIFGKAREFYAVFPNSSGLAPSNEVTMNGVKVGQVLEVDIHPNYYDSVLVKFTIDKDEIQIPEGSYVELISSDILGTKALDLRLNTEPKLPGMERYHEDQDTLFATTQESLEEQIEKEILPLKKKTEELIGSVENIIVSINAFWDTSAAYTIDESLYEVRDAIGTFAELANHLSVLIATETDRVDGILRDVNKITDNLVSNSERINNTLDNISAISDTIADSKIKDVILETKSTLTELNGVLSMVNEGEGALGQFIHDTTLYEDVKKTNQELMDLLDDVQTNPNKYIHFSIFGRKVDGVSLPANKEKKLNDFLDTLGTN